MNLKLIIISLILLSCKPNDCKGFKVGKFMNYENGEWTNTIITRTDEFQIELNKKTNEESKDKITWIDDCTYRLTSITYKNKPVTKTTPDLIVKIVNVGTDFYEIEASVEGKKPSYWSKMKKVD